MTEEQIIEFTKTVPENKCYVKSCIDLLPDEFKTKEFLDKIWYLSVLSSNTPYNICSNISNLSVLQKNDFALQFSINNYKKDRGI